MLIMFQITDLFLICITLNVKLVKLFSKVKSLLILMIV